MDRRPIFGIGLPKSGTTSLNDFLQMQRLRAWHNPVPLREAVYQRGDFDCGDGWDALTNFGEWWFPQLDQLYPHARWILTLRDEDAWLDTCARHFTTPPPSRLHQLLMADVFGSLRFHRGHFRDVYRRHLATVGDYFVHRVEDLLILHTDRGTPAEKAAAVCRFLEIDPPADAAYPWSNRSAA